jgi:hypothetical protein
LTNAASTRQIASRAKQRKDDADGEAHTIRNIMQHPMGRRWMWLQLSAASIFIDDMNTDPGWMAYQKGQRNLGLALLNSVLRHAPNDYIRMTNENTTANLKEESDGGSADDPDQ